MGWTKKTRPAGPTPSPHKLLRLKFWSRVYVEQKIAPTNEVLQFRRTELELGQRIAAEFFEVRVKANY
jgi:hypothetical protein